MSQFNPLGPASMFLSGMGQGANIAQGGQNTALAIQQQVMMERERQRQAAYQQQVLAQQAQRDELSGKRFKLDQRQYNDQRAMVGASQGVNAGRAEQAGMFRIGSPLAPQNDAAAYQQFAGADPVTQRASLEQYIEETSKKRQYETALRQIDALFGETQITPKQRMMAALQIAQSLPASEASLVLRNLPEQGAAPIVTAQDLAAASGGDPMQARVFAQLVNSGRMTPDQAIGEMRLQAQNAGQGGKTDLRPQRAALQAELVALEAMPQDEADISMMDADYESKAAEIQATKDRIVQIRQQLAYLNLGQTPPGQQNAAPVGGPVSELPPDAPLSDAAIQAAYQMLGPDADAQRVYQVARAAQAMMGGGQ